ncbi:MAG: hydroxymethylbilane synthase, partial [Verrucomicrobiota bacterium]|nr:hydroxymethylbilane synthase [Verrucomicrobiota bacterium]
MSEKAGQGTIVLGTRGSALALVQADMVEEALRRAWPGLEIERRIIKTTGDQRTDVPLSEVAQVAQVDKGIFIKELELEAGEIDVAVHSLKDVPSVLEEGFAIAAVLPRAAVRDVLVTTEERGLRGLRKGAKVATSSVRRRRLLESLRPDLRVVDIRGNVPTRIRKLHESGEIDGLLLAQAGLARLGLLGDGLVESEGKEAYAEELDEKSFVPAGGQGAVALEIRSGDDGALATCEAVNDTESMLTVRAERSFLTLLGAGCDTPVGVNGTMIRKDDEGGGTGDLLLRAVVFEDDEPEPLVGEVSGAGEDSEGLAARLLAGLAR